ncbi:hypothetical protein GLOTRDRAFT_96062 [Gloeophyllum trabeum ATCC 11539]|uniref:Mid2 domain-containing protein n=1 Tax=Gloeophyllum trabeum (strain ATCC 11539 / FP-39264 / Madison 617) TaxID=670483 RepID=S7PWL3_GLOTA|nr:uncharacterized protein GLOTRDRAFT_96062 [Gloeophyllum trabeum ATCC 11539]EPQ51991.1 hypothetical protein GLOTRDRAFT_96062 [Gloeophyllum trabeum ATCC 11539]
MSPSVVNSLRNGILSVLVGASCTRLAVAQTFSLSFSAPTECDDMNVSWTGGTPPFDLYLTPVYGTPRNISVPASVFSNGRGAYQVQIPFPRGQQMVLSMLDATGVPSGGTSDLLTVGPNIGGNRCNTSDPGVDFFYELNTPLVQCQPYTFSNYSNAVQPVQIMAIIPAKNPMLLHPPVGPTLYNWTTNITAGTNVIFVVTDSEGRQGGASNVSTVGYSSDSSCLTVATTSSALVPPTQTWAPSDASGNSGLAPGAIAGIIIGCIVAVASMILVAWFFLRRRRDSSSPRPIDIDLAGHEPDPFPRMSQLTPGAYEPTPFLLDAPGGSRSREESPASPVSPPTPSGRTSYTHDEEGQRYLSPTSSSRARKVTSSSRYSTSNNTYSEYPPSRVLVHQDAEDVLSPEEEDYVELPPQYREDRRPLSSVPGLPYADDVNSPTPSGSNRGEK